jgi:LuxR family maltose regulon positive regulatory protein
MAAHPELEVVIQSSLGAASVAAGRPAAAAAAFTSAAAQGLRAGAAEASILALGQGALLAALRGDLERACDLAMRALRLSASCAPARPALRWPSDVALAYLHTERQDLAAAQRLAEPRSEDPHVPDGPLVPVVLALVRARLRRAAGDLAGALQVLGAATAAADLPAWLADVLRREQAAVGVTAGLSHHPPEFREPPADGELVGSDSPESGPARPPALAVPEQRRPAESLTDDETAVLRQLAHRRTTEEIAAELRVPVDTVRTHVRRMAPKLVAARPTAAAGGSTPRSCCAVE